MILEIATLQIRPGQTAAFEGAFGQAQLIISRMDGYLKPGANTVSIPVNGLYTGASEPGPGGEPRDACYHRSCDRLRNVNRAVLAEMAAAAKEALRRLSAQAK